MSNWIMEGVWKVDYHRPGPTVAIIGGLHGNERTGVSVIRRLRKLDLMGKLDIRAGRLLIVEGNPLAVAAGVRYLRQDINRLFTAALLAIKNPTDPELRRAQQLAKLLSKADYVLDLHATILPTAEPFLVVQPRPSAEVLELIGTLSVPKVVCDPHFIFGGGEPVSLDEYVWQQGGVGLCYETGWANDKSRVDIVVGDVLRFLRHLGVLRISDEILAPCGVVGRELYEMERAVILDATGFCWHNGTGYHNLYPLTAGQVVGWQGEIQVVVTVDSIMVFPKHPDSWVIGKPVCYLAKKR